ncbi:hypothetical protein [Enterococcus sp. LJL128]
MAGGRLWTEEDDIYLEYFVFGNDTPLKEAALFLNRSEKSISYRLWALRKENPEMKLMSKPWTDKEDAYLKNNYPMLTPEAISIRLGRTEGAVQRRASRLGIRKRKDIKIYDKEIREMLASGCYLIDVSEKLNLTMGSLITYLRAQNIPYKTMPLEERKRRNKGFRKIITDYQKLQSAKYGN